MYPLQVCKGYAMIDLKTIANHAENLNDCWTLMATFEGPKTSSTDWICALMQEDIAPAHNHWLQRYLFDTNNVLML